MPEGAVGLVAGVFDLFHVGHLDAVLRSAARSDRLLVGVAGDALAESVTGRRPFVPEIERREIVGAVRGVEGVVLLDDEDDLGGQLAATGADVVLVAGADEVAERIAAAAGAAGLAVVRLGAGRATASTAVRAALREAEAQEQGRSSVA